MQRVPNQRFSLFTPTFQRAPVQQTDSIPSSKKRKRETFEIQSYKILPDLAPVAENIDKKYVPLQTTYEQEQIVVKTDKALETRSQNLRDSIKTKSDRMLKFKSITHNVDSYVELDEKVIDLINIKDFGMNNEYEFCFDEFIKAKSIPLPSRVMEVYKECNAHGSYPVKCVTQVYPEANLVILTINNYLFLWQYFVNSNIEDYDASSELETKFNDKSTFYEHQMKGPIRAVGLGKPIARVFPSQDVAYVLAVATSFNVQLYTLSFTQSSILMKYTDLETNLDDEMLINKIIFSKTGKIYAAQTNEEVVMLNYEGGKSFQKLIPFWGSNPLQLQPSKKKSLLTDISKKFTSIFIQPFQKNYLYSMVDLAIDNTRHILYAYGIKVDNECDFMIQVYDLGVTGEELKLLTLLRAIDIKREIKMKCKFEERELMTLKIAAMIPIEKNVSESLQLLLVTNLGIRLYLQFRPPPGYEMGMPSQPLPGQTQVFSDADLVGNYKVLTEPNRPTDKYNVRFVKFPIVQTMESLQDQTSQYPLHHRVKLSSANIISAQNKRIVSAVNYKRNLFVILGEDEPNANYHQLYAITVNNAFQARAKSVYGNQRIIPENVSLCNVPNNIFINSLVPKEDQYLLTRPLARLLGYELPEHMLKQKFIGTGKAGMVSMDCLSDLVRQVYYPPHITLMLDDYELHYLVKFRPIDLLYQILVANDETELLQFFDRYGRGEACSMLLQLICNVGARYYFNTDTDRNYLGDGQKKPENAAFTERTQFRSQPEERSFRIVQVTNELRQRAIEVLSRYGNSLSNSEFTDHTKKQGELSLGTFIEPQKRKYTSQLEGIFIYFSRVVRPIWSNYLLNFYVYEGYVPGQLPFYKQEDLLVLKNRLEEMREFFQTKGSTLLSQGGGQDPDQKPYTSTSTINIAQIAKEGFNQQIRQNQELQDILLEDQQTINNFNGFLEKTIQALDIFMCLINDPLDLKSCIYELGPNDSNKFVKLRFHDILRDGEYEALFRSLLYIKLLKVNEGQFSDLAHQFKARFWMFFSSTDIHVCRAEKSLEMAYVTKDQTERNKAISIAVDILRENAEYIPKERLSKLFDLFGAMNLTADFIRILIERIKTLVVLQAKLRNASSTSSDEIIKVTLTEIAGEISLCREYVLNILQEIQSAIDNRRERVSIFSGMNIEALKQLKKKIITYIQSFDDEFIHASWIKFLIRTGHFEDILNFESPYVEGVLSKSEELEERDIVLFDFFNQTHQYEKAFNAALNIATKDQSGEVNGQYVVEEIKVIPIESRISYLRSALQCLQKAIEKSSDPDKHSSLIKQRNNLNALIERTEIQQKAVESYTNLLKARNLLEAEKAIKYEEKRIELHRQILDPVDLFDKYIAEDDLFECKLMALNLEAQPATDEIELTYDQLLNDIYEQNPKAWPRSIKEKLLELHALFSKREKLMFPIIKILLVIENINANHEPFLNTLQQLLDSLMGPQQKKKGTPTPQVNLIKEEMQYWATYFFIDKLGFSFKQVFAAYREIYEMQKELQGDSEETPFILFHLSNCILVLIEWWLIKAGKHLAETSSMGLFGRKSDLSTSFTEINSSRDELEEMMDKIKDDLRQWGESRMFDPRMIDMARRLSALVEDKYQEIAKILRDQSAMYNTSLDTTREKLSKKDYSQNESYRNYSKR